MALIKCPECGKEISDQCEVCIHCGYPFAKKQTTATFDGVDYDIAWLKNTDIYWVEKLNVIIKNIKAKHNDITPELLYGAKDFIRKYHPQQQTQPKESTPALQNVPKCPTCGSTDVEKISLGKKVVGGALFGLFSSNVRKTMHCRSCGYKW